MKENKPMTTIEQIKKDIAKAYADYIKSSSKNDVAHDEHHRAKMALDLAYRKAFEAGISAKDIEGVTSLAL
jgi:outer membrane protein TolC